MGLSSRILGLYSNHPGQDTDHVLNIIRFYSLNNDRDFYRIRTGQKTLCSLEFHFSQKFYCNYQLFNSVLVFLTPLVQYAEQDL